MKFYVKLSKREKNFVLRCSLKTLVDLTRPTSAMFAGAPFMPVIFIY